MEEGRRQKRPLEREIGVMEKREMGRKRIFNRKEEIFLYGCSSSSFIIIIQSDLQALKWTFLRLIV